MSDDDLIGHEDDAESFDAGDYSAVTVNDAAAEALYLDACRRAAEAGF